MVEGSKAQSLQPRRMEGLVVQRLGPGRGLSPGRLRLGDRPWELEGGEEGQGGKDKGGGRGTRRCSEATCALRRERGRRRHWGGLGRTSGAGHTLSFVPVDGDGVREAVFQGSSTLGAPVPTAASRDAGNGRDAGVPGRLASSAPAGGRLCPGMQSAAVCRHGRGGVSGSRLQCGDWGGCCPSPLRAQQAPPRAQPGTRHLRRGCLEGWQAGAWAPRAAVRPWDWASRVTAQGGGSVLRVGRFPDRETGAGRV